METMVVNLVSSYNLVLHPESTKHTSSEPVDPQSVSRISVLLCISIGQLASKPSLDPSSTIKHMQSTIE